MSKVNTNKNSYESLKALFFSGKVKPSLNKIVSELENDPNNLEFTLLACQCLQRGKNFDGLSEYADKAISINPQRPEGHYYKGIALHHTKGKEQEALKNFTEAIAIEPENVVFLQDKATTHLSLYTDYHLPLPLAEKHRAKGEDILMKIVALVEANENPTFTEYLTVADVSTTLKRKVEAKKFYLKAVKAFDQVEEADRNMNLYKDIIKGQKACAKLMEKFTEF